MSYINFLLISLLAMAIYYAVVILLDGKGKRNKNDNFQDITVTGYNFDEEMNQYNDENYYDEEPLVADYNDSDDINVNVDDVPRTDDSYSYEEQDVQESVSSNISIYDELVSTFNQSRIQFNVDSLKLTRDIFL